MLFRKLLGHDIFISYSRADKDYAKKLKEQLSSMDYSCFIDYEKVFPGDRLSGALKRAIRWSSVFVLVGTDHSRNSKYVAQEVDEYLKTGRTMVPILLGGAFTMSEWPVIRDNELVWVDEPNAEAPSPVVFDEINRLFKRNRVKVWRRTAGTALTLVLLAISAFAVLQAREARAQQALAEKTTADLVVKQKELKNSTAELTRQQELLKKQNEVLEKGKLDLEKKTKEAKENAEKAQHQEELARENAERAKEQEQIANQTAAGAFAEAALAKKSGNEAIAWLPNTPPTFANIGRAMSAVQTGTSFRLWEIGDWRESGLVRWSPNGKLLAYAPYDDASIWVADVRDGRIRAVPRRLEVGGSNTHHGIHELSWSPNSRYLASVADDNTVEIWTESDGQVHRSTSYPVNIGRLLHELAWSPTGELLHADAQGTIQGFKILNDRIESILVVNNPALLPRGEISGMNWSPDAGRLALATKDGSLWLWERATQASRLLRASAGQDILRIAWSPNGNTLAVTDADGLVTLFSGSDLNSAETFVAIPNEGDRPESDVPAAPPSAAYKTAIENYAEKLRKLPGKPMNNLTLAENQGRLAVDAVWSPDGNTLAMASSGGAIWFLDVRKRVQHKLGSGIPPLRWSPSGVHLASQGQEGILRLWDLQPRRISGLWPQREAVFRDLRAADKSLVAIEWSVDDRSVVTASPLGAVEIWDAQTEPGMVVQGLIMKRPTEIAWSSTGRFLAIRSFRGSELEVWDRTNGRIRHFPDLVEAWRPPVTWSSTQSLLAFPTQKQGVTLYDAEQDRVEQLDSRGQIIHSVAWSRDGSRLLGAADQNLIVWDIASRKSYTQVTVKPTQNSRSWSLDWSPDGTTVVVAQSDGTLFFWSPLVGSTRIIRHETDRDPMLHRVNWISDRIVIIERNDFTIEYRDVQLDSNLNETAPNEKGFFHRYVGNLNSYSWSSGRKWLAVASRSEAMVEVYDSSLHEVVELQGHRGREVGSVSWSPDGTILASGGGGRDSFGARGTPDCDVRIWEPASKNSLVLSGHRETVWGLAWSPDGKWLASSADDGTVRVWEYPTGEAFQEFLKNRTNVSVDHGHIAVKPFSGLPWARLK